MDQEMIRVDFEKTGNAWIARIYRDQRKIYATAPVITLKTAMTLAQRFLDEIET